MQAKASSRRKVKHYLHQRHNYATTCLYCGYAPKRKLTKKKTEDRRQKTEDRRQKTEDRRQPIEAEKSRKGKRSIPFTFAASYISFGYTQTTWSCR
ncbi:hypothetical protein GBN28_03995 [Plesiomonas shigelloides]|nr:hypothetical protein GBN28_03995 [Plesiomonas shigelloides]